MIRRIRILSLSVLISTLNFSCGNDIPPENLSSNPENLSSNTVDISLCTFNIQILGQAKIGRSKVVDALVGTALECDLLFIQELKNRPPADTTEGPVITTYLERVNAKAETTYAMKVSPRVGTGGSTEQYAVFYNSNKVNFVEEFVYNDTDDDFSREPHVTIFSVAETIFAVGNNHFPPSDAENEIEALEKVIPQITQTENILLLGDFNADGTYFSESDWENITLIQDGYKNLVDDARDTTVATSDNTYDRILVSPSIDSLYVQDSIQVLNWNTFLPEIKSQGCADGYIPVNDCPNPTDQAIEKEISDHYPVKILLRFSCSDSEEECTNTTD